MPALRSSTVVELARNLRAFLSLEAGLTRGEAPGPPRPAYGDLLGLVENGRLEGMSGPVREAALNLSREIRLARISEESARRLRSLEGKDLKLHLGAGRDVRPGWINVDLAFETSRERGSGTPPAALLFEYDLRRGLPLRDGSCGYVYSSHFFEHLEYRHGVRLMRDCYRVLRPGGVFRVALPTFKDLFARYLDAGGDPEDIPDMSPEESRKILRLLPDLEPGTETFVDWINYGVYQGGEHRYVYDEKKVVLLLERIGYASVEASRYEEGMDPDADVRRRHSFYVEAVK